MTLRSKGTPLHRLPWRHRFGAVAAALIVGTATLPTTASAQDGSGTVTTVDVAQLDGISSVPQNPRQPIGDELSNALAAPVPARVLGLADGRTAIPFPLTAVGNSISVQGEDGEGSVTIPVPAGLTPVAIRANLVTTPDVQDGYLTYFGGSLPANFLAVGSATRTAVETEVELNLRGIEVRDGRARLSLQTVLKSLRPGCSARLAQATLELRGGAFIYEGAATPPVAPTSFLGPVTNRVTIVLPDAPKAAEATAAVRVAATIARLRHDLPPTIEVLGASAAAAQPFELDSRRIEIAGDHPDEISVVADPVQGSILRFGGPDARLLQNVAVFEGDLSEVLVNGTAEIGSYEPDAEAGPLDPAENSGLGSTKTGAEGSSLTFPLKSLGLDSTQRRGVGTLELPLLVDQSKLGGSVKTMRIHLEGNHTPPPKGAEAMLTLYVADTLVASLDLTKSVANEAETSWAFALDIDVSSELLGRTTGSVLRVDYIPPGGDCKVGAAPFVIQVDPVESFYQVDYGQGNLPGFAQIPQALWPSFSVALDEVSIDRVAIAARLIADLQGLATADAQPTVVPLAGANDIDGPRVVIGEGALDGRGYITLGGQRVIRGSEAQKRLTLSVDEPLAGLSAFRRDGDLHLDLFWTNGTGSPAGIQPGLALAQSLLGTIEGKNRSFRDLYGDTYLFAPDTPPVSMALGDQPVQPTEARRAPDYLARALPMAGGAAVVGFVLFGLAWFRRRRQRPEAA
jgi:hypothetical protein